MTMPDLPAGHIVTADELGDITDQIDSLTTGWVDYSGTFTLTASTTSPTKGNSTYSAWYRRPANADLVVVRIGIAIGSTFSGGSGTYRFALPVNAHADEIAHGIGQAYVLDAGTTNRIGICYPGAAGYLHGVFDNVVGDLSNAIPQTWANGDLIKLRFIYRPA